MMSEPVDQNIIEGQARLVTDAHQIDIVPAPKMDTPSLVAAVCSCGEYRSGSTTENEARKSGLQHVMQKAKNLADQLYPDGDPE